MRYQETGVGAGGDRDDHQRSQQQLAIEPIAEIGIKQGVKDPRDDSGNQHCDEDVDSGTVDGPGKLAFARSYGSKGRSANGLTIRWTHLFKQQ